MKVIDTTKEPKWLRHLTPSYYVESVTDIDFAELRNRGVRAAAFDVDSTLVPFDEIELSSESEKYLLAAKKAGHIDEFYIATNRRTNNIEELATSIGAQVIHALSCRDSKPWGSFFERLLDKIDRPAHECAMVGDKVFTDILGGNRAGMQTILVEKLGEDSNQDKIMPFRRIEKYLANRYQYK